MPIAVQGVEPDGEVARFIAEREWTPTVSELSSFTGDWYSEEARATFTFAVEGDKAFIKQRPVTNIPLRPLYKDHFGAQGYIVWFTRDRSGKIDKLHIGGSRMRDMPFTRTR